MQLKRGNHEEGSTYFSLLKIKSVNMILSAGRAGMMPVELLETEYNAQGQRV